MTKKGRPRKEVNKLDNHYVNNKEFLEQIILYKQNPDDRKNYEKIGTNVLKIANKLILMGKFASYDQARKNEMISNACFYMIKYCLKGFDPVKYNNPFSYFTETTKKAFWQHINKEKEKDAVFSRLSYIDTLEDNDSEYEQ